MAISGTYCKSEVPTVKKANVRAKFEGIYWP